jgi:hypothetical protein
MQGGAMVKWWLSRLNSKRLNEPLVPEQGGTNNFISLFSPYLSILMLQP